MIWTFIVFIAIVISWFWFEGRWDRRLFAVTPGKVCENLRPRAAMELLRSRDDVQVLDVRSSGEFASGALPGALNISTGHPDFRQRVANLDKSKPVLVYCAGGFRSRRAVEALRELGFGSIDHLHRGCHSWHFAGLPISSPAKSASRPKS
jgi:rhodanese-related sulfurtransferase